MTLAITAVPDVLGPGESSRICVDDPGGLAHVVTITDGAVPTPHTTQVTCNPCVEWQRPSDWEGGAMCTSPGCTGKTIVFT